MKKFVTGFTTNFDGVTFGSADEGAKTVIVSTIAAGSFGAVYGFVPEVREKVVEKITQIIYDTVGPGRLHQIPAVTDLRYTEKDQMVRFNRSANAESYYVVVENLTSKKMLGITSICNFIKVSDMRDFRTGDDVKITVVAEGDMIKTRDSEPVSIEYKMQDMDNIVCSSISKYFFKKMSRLNDSTTGGNLREATIDTLEQEGNFVKITGSAIGMFNRPVNYVYSDDITQYKTEFDYDLSELQNFTRYVYGIRKSVSNGFSVSNEYKHKYTDIAEKIQESGAFADLESKGYTVDELQYSNGEFEANQDQKIETVYSATYRATHPTLKRITYRQSHKLTHDFVEGWQTADYLAAFKNGEGGVLSSEKENVVGGAMMNHLYEMKDKHDYVSFLEDEQQNQTSQSKQQSDREM